MADGWQDGLPPVGAECEFTAIHRNDPNETFNDQFMEGRVDFVSAKGMVITRFDGLGKFEDNQLFIDFENYHVAFHPIKSEADNRSLCSWRIGIMIQYEWHPEPPKEAGDYFYTGLLPGTQKEVVCIASTYIQAGRLYACFYMPPNWRGNKSDGALYQAPVEDWAGLWAGPEYGLTHVEG